MTSDDDGRTAVREQFVDHFTRIRQLVERLTDGLSSQTATFRPDAQANSVAWLLWHLARVQDDHVSDLAATEQVWTTAGWYERFKLPFDESDYGYGHSPEQVAAVDTDAELLDAYQAAVHESCLRYVETLTPPDLARIVDDAWDPPVTAGARLVSVIGDCLQHGGQAAYVRGLAERRP